MVGDQTAPAAWASCAELWLNQSVDRVVLVLLVHWVHCHVSRKGTQHCHVYKALTKH